jgi:pilus assembly protein CpaE
MTQDITAILLPSSRVDFFALDNGTAETAEKLAADWRFARVGVAVTRGGIDDAVAHYSVESSPEIVIIETDDISESFIEKLGQLAGVCTAGTDAVIVGPMNDVHLYRNLVSMGVRDYLVRPVSEEDFVSVIAKALVEKRGISSSRLVTVIGSKGGVGTTSIAQMLAWNIASTIGEKTVLMDMAGSAGTLGVSYGIEPSTTLAEGVRLGTSGTEDDLKRVVQNAGENLSLLVFGGDPMLSDPPGADAAEALVDRLMHKSPVIVMDLSGASPAVQKRMLVRSCHVVMVATPLLSSLRNARTLLGEIKTARNSLKEVELVLNMRGLGGAGEVTGDEIKKVLDIEPSATIDHAPKIFAAAEALGKFAEKAKTSGDIFDELLGVSERSAGKLKKIDFDSGRKSGGAFGFLKKLSKKGK